jgi:hypothetical protein
MSAVDLAERTEVREVPFSADLAVIRRLADLLPGAKPRAVNGIRLAASLRPDRLVFQGA